jgi:dynein heavy chain, axonemal
MGANLSLRMGVCFQVLANQQGSILDDQTAVEVITKAKQLGNDVAAKQAAAEVTRGHLEAARKQYEPCGMYTAALFFCISDLVTIDPMYQYSLPW